MKLVSFLILSLVFGLTGLSAGDNPNILVADDLERADYSAHGTKDIRTPNIDKLAREGMTFENFGLQR